MGLFGIFDKNGDCAKSTYFGLMSLQHRGQESCGIAVNRNKDIFFHKNEGLLSEVFNDKKLDELGGTMAVGHVKYSSINESGQENAQPLVLRYQKGNLAIAFDGCVLNADALRSEFSSIGAIFQTSSDSEVMAYAIARERLKTHSIEEAVNNALKLIHGCYSLLVMSPRKLIAARDPHGVRPLSIGVNGEQISIASETCAFDAVGTKFVRDIKPGEIVTIDNGAIRSNTDNCGDNSSLCVFEYIYFSRPDSVVCNQHVYESRKLAGRILAQDHPVDADVVIGVPDSGIGAAIGYSKESGIPYDEGFVKSKYVGRTFIKPTQKDRELAVRIKLNVLKTSVENKRVVMVDDSIVRGTTCARIINQLREAGAKEVHVRISSPLFLWPCYYGTDVASKDDLVATRYNLKELQDMINADSLGFLSMPRLSEIAPNSKEKFCDACFTGNYPIKPSKCCESK